MMEEEALINAVFSYQGNPKIDDTQYSIMDWKIQNYILNQVLDGSKLRYNARY